MAGETAIGGKATQAILKFVEPIVFKYRVATLTVLTLITVVLGWQAAQLQPNAGWLKMVPQEHPYMQTFLEYYKDFGGANTVLVSMKVQDGDLYTPERLQKLQQLTDEGFFIPGVDRTRVTSILTPNIIYVEIIEGGMAGETVRPKNWGDGLPSQAIADRVRVSLSLVASCSIGTAREMTRAAAA